jgi:3-oxoacyl-[acyl-carrier-protein] synthase-3
MPAYISSVGHFVPPEVFDNKYFEDKIETTDEWIRERTGIIERRFATSGATSDLIVPAVQQCLEKRGISALEVDLILVATITADNNFPSCAATVQRKIGAINAWGYDISAACSGFMYALATATSMVNAGIVKKALVIGADKMSSILDFTDRNTCILFGDGAGCVLIEHTDDESIGVKDTILHMDGEGGKYLYQIAGGSAKPASIETVERREHFVYQDGKSVYKHAVIGMAEVAVEIMRRNNISPDEIAYLVPHQANLRIIDATRQRMGISYDKVMINIHKYGNTTAGTIPICLSEWYYDNKLKKGDKLILASFGAGFTWGSIYVVWGID